MTSNEILAAVRRRYGNEAVVISEVADATGATSRRRIDALALGCWPSRGLYVHAIEIKVDKGDLRRELDNPAKADRIARFCDGFFLATPAGWDEEVPAWWGWYEVDGLGGVHLRRAAQKIDAEPLSRSFVMAIARSLAEQGAPEVALRQAEEAGRSAQRAEDEAEVARLYKEMAALRRELAVLQCSMRGIIDNLTGNVGSLNSIRVQAREILRHAEQVEEVARGVFEVAT